MIKPVKMKLCVKTKDQTDVTYEVRSELELGMSNTRSVITF